MLPFQFSRPQQMSTCASTWECLSVQEVYMSEVKVVLKKALGVVKEDEVEQNGHSNGFSENGSHKDEGEQERAMDTQEEGDAIKSPSASKGRGGRRSKADSEPKSELKGFTAFNYTPYVTTALQCVLDVEYLVFINGVFYSPTESPVSTRVTRNSGKQPTILSMFSRV